MFAASGAARFQGAVVLASVEQQPGRDRDKVLGSRLWWSSTHGHDQILHVTPTLGCPLGATSRLGTYEVLGGAGGEGVMKRGMGGKGGSVCISFGQIHT